MSLHCNHIVKIGNIDKREIDFYFLVTNHLGLVKEKFVKQVREY